MKNTRWYSHLGPSGHNSRISSTQKRREDSVSSPRTAQCCLQFPLLRETNTYPHLRLGQRSSERILSLTLPQAPGCDGVSWAVFSPALLPCRTQESLPPSNKEALFP